MLCYIRVGRRNGVFIISVRKTISNLNINEAIEKIIWIRLLAHLSRFEDL
jgi:hypothetical protein